MGLPISKINSGLIYIPYVGLTITSVTYIDSDNVTQTLTFDGNTLTFL